MWPTPELTNQVAGAIRAGAYAHVAAAAYGVPRQAFRDWMRRGRLQRRGACRDFWTEVEKAKSLTRALAEREVREQDIRFWLRFGPGKGGGPCWGPAPRRLHRPKGADDALADPEFRKFLAGLVELLQPHPELRKAVIALVDDCWKTNREKTNPRKDRHE